VKLHVIGIPSAGKTTLGKELSRLLEIPFYALDAIAYLDERWTERSPAERDELVRQILERPARVTEGGFLGWTSALFEAADRIVWLDPPLRTLVWRHLRRHARQPWRIPSQLAFQIRMYLRAPGEGPLASDPDQTRTGIGDALRSWRRKVIRVTRPVTAIELVDAFGLSMSADN